MKKKLIMSLVLGLAASCGATVFPSGTLDATIPSDDYNGLAETITVSGMDSLLTGVSVTLDVSGGYNGDLYAYLTYDGQTITLLNRVGQGTGSNPTYTYGYADAGLNVTLADGAANGSIHNYQTSAYNLVGGQETGTFTPDSGTTFASTYE